MRVLTLSSGQRTVEADACVQDLHLNIQLRGHAHLSSWVLHSEVFHLAQDKLDKLGEEPKVPRLKLRLERKCSIHVVLQPKGKLTKLSPAKVDKIIQALIFLVYYCTGHSPEKEVGASLQVLQENKCHALVQDLIRSVNTELRQLAILKGVGLTKRFELLLEREEQEARALSSPSSVSRHEKSTSPQKKKLRNKEERLSKVKLKLEKLQKLLGLKVEENMRLQLELINLTSENSAKTSTEPTGPTPKQEERCAQAKTRNCDINLAKGNTNDRMVQLMADFVRKDFALCQVFSSMVLIQLTLYKLERSLASNLYARKKM